MSLAFDLSVSERTRETVGYITVYGENSFRYRLSKRKLYRASGSNNEPVKYEHRTMVFDQ